MTVVSLEDIKRLPIAERIKLVEDIWDTIASNQDGVPVTDAQRGELDRRLKEFAENPRAGKTWDEIRKQLG